MDDSFLFNGMTPLLNCCQIRRLIFIKCHEATDPILIQCMLMASDTNMTKILHETLVAKPPLVIRTAAHHQQTPCVVRSEERRVGKEC